MSKVLGCTHSQKELMHENNPSPYTEKQWLIAVRSLENEFDIQFEKIQVKDQVKKLFFNYVGLHHFSSEACIALYYRLFFYSTLLLVQIIESEGFKIEDFFLNDLQPVYLSSVARSVEAKDSPELEDVLKNINLSLEVLIYDFIENRAPSSKKKGG
jgi:hypothetical protein